MPHCLAASLWILPLRELEAAAGLGLAVFLALDDAAVAGEEPAMLQRRAQSRLVEHQRPADAVAHRAGLARQPAALDRGPDIELAHPVGDEKRLVDQHAQHRPSEIDRAVAAVDLDLAVARPDPYSGDRVLALAGGVGAALLIDLRLHV